MAGVVASDVQWDSLSLAGAFLIGAALATIATIRVVKHVTNYFASLVVTQPLDKSDEPDDEGQ
jgi:hypothetical protein